MSKADETFEAAQSGPVIKSVKGFNSEFQCFGGGQPFQFEVGKTYTTPGAVRVCHNGFHACDRSPFDVWNHYPLIGDDGKLTRYADTEQSGATDREDATGGSKVASATITIKPELSLPQFIKRGVEWLVNNTSAEAREQAVAASGDYSKLAASGNYSQLAASGNYSKLAASGDYSKLAASGSGSVLAASGNGSKLAASGDRSVLAASRSGSKLAASGDRSVLAASGSDSKLAASGDRSVLAASGSGSELAASGNGSQLAASGNYSQLAASGNYSKLAASGSGSKLAASGNGSKLAASGDRSVLAASGAHTSARGGLGTWIALAEYKDGKCIGFATGCIGTDGLEPDTTYVAKDGKLVAA
jgi:hypothetical protein